MVGSSLMNRKHCGKRRNCPLRAISHFPTVFSKSCTADTKNQGLFGKGLNRNNQTLHPFHRRFAFWDHKNDRKYICMPFVRMPF